MGILRSAGFMLLCKQESATKRTSVTPIGTQLTSFRARTSKVPGFPCKFCISAVTSII